MKMQLQSWAILQDSCPLCSKSAVWLTLILGFCPFNLSPPELLELGKKETKECPGALTVSAWGVA